MSSLESLIATSGESPMPDALSFTLPPASTSCVDRKQHVRAYTTTASALSPTGAKTFRIRLGGDEMVDSSSVRLMYTLVNNHATKPLVPLCGPWGPWGQVYLRSAGVELDNIPLFNRFYQQFFWNHLSQTAQYSEASISGFGGSWLQSNNSPNMGTIPGAGSVTVMHRLPLSLFLSGKMLPTRYCPLEVEGTLTNAAANWLNTADTNSQEYTIQNIQLLMDTVMLDEAVLHSFYSALLSGRTLSIPTFTVYQTVQTIPAGNTSYNFSCVRAFSRLSHIWLTFRNGGAGGGAMATSFICPTAGIANGTGPTPALGDGNVPTVRLSIGPHNWPDPSPNGSVAEQFYMFQKALNGAIPNIDRDDFLTNAYTIAYDVRKVPQDPTSALSTRSGDLVAIFLDKLTADRATEVWCTFFAFSVCGIRESGVTLLT